MDQYINYDDCEIDFSQLRISDNDATKIANNSSLLSERLSELPEKIWMAIDFETIDDFSLKLFCKTDPIQIGFVIYNFEDNSEIFKFGSFIHPKNKFNFANISKIKWNDVKNAPTLEDITPVLKNILKKCEFIVTHNYPTELGVLKVLFPTLHIKIYDTLFSSRRNFKDCKGHKLNECCQRLHIDCGNLFLL
jgi:DNA polymerase III epsilon subunit-like protein